MMVSCRIMYIHLSEVEVYEGKFALYTFTCPKWKCMMISCRIIYIHLAEVEVYDGKLSHYIHSLGRGGSV